MSWHLELLGVLVIGLIEREREREREREMKIKDR
jgi:hypothetical protein